MQWGPLLSAVPEALWCSVAGTPGGGIDPDAIDLLTNLKRPFDAILIGPGMQDEASTCEFAMRLLCALGPTSVILDATAMGAVKQRRESSVPVLITPHAGEMAHLLGIAKEGVVKNRYQLPAKLRCTGMRSWL